VPSKEPEQPLELYSFESSPFARVVRERLSELELPYVLRSAGRSTMADWVPPALRDAMKWRHEPQTVNRQTLKQRAGRVTIPYLVDPNTGTELGESAAILEYLDATYGS
jgi:glutathione S-transferase